jgi:hypothetical protein
MASTESSAVVVPMEEKEECGFTSQSLRILLAAAIERFVVIASVC